MQTAFLAMLEALCCCETYWSCAAVVTLGLLHSWGGHQRCWLFLNGSAGEKWCRYACPERWQLVVVVFRSLDVRLLSGNSEKKVWALQLHSRFHQFSTFRLHNYSPTAQDSVSCSSHSALEACYSHDACQVHKEEAD